MTLERWRKLMCSLGLHKWIWTPCGIWCKWCEKIVEDNRP
jgi:hypothetical protein